MSSLLICIQHTTCTSRIPADVASDSGVAADVAAGVAAGTAFDSSMMLQCSHFDCKAAAEMQTAAGWQ